IKINPMPRMSGVPWGLSLTMGIIITVLSINPHISIHSDMATPTGLPLSAETKVLKTGEMPVDVLKISPMPLLASKQDDDDDGEPAPSDLQNAAPMAAHGEGGIWAIKANRPTASYVHSLCVVDGLIYAIGGAGVGVVETYDPVADRWAKKKNVPINGPADGCVTMDGIIYATKEGGIGTYDPDAENWQDRKGGPDGRDLWISMVDGIIYAIGGHIGHGGNALSAVDAYDPVEDAWIKKKDMPTARTYLSTVAVDGIIYAIGGSDAEAIDKLNVLSTVEAYDPATDTWAEKADMPTARMQLACVAANGKIYAIGGSGGIGVGALSVVEVYDPATDTWIEENDMPTARGICGAAAVDGKIYVIGGAGVNENWNAPVAIVEEYTPEGWPFLSESSVSPQGKLPTTWGEIKSD
ncbi:Kelch repeat-containing protein, partial [Candidatus Poribacteria bacterium]